MISKSLKVNSRNIVIDLILGDITAVKADAIVNAAHEALLGGGGVDGAIHKAAGPFLLRECREMPADKNGVRCPTGEARITGAYNLIANHVIHTVAPKFIGGIIRREVNGKLEPIFKNAHPERDIEMANCYKNCIKLADDNKLKSIAFPSLGTGGHAYPIEVACLIAINSTLEYLYNNAATNIEKVTFVCFSQVDYDYYEKTMNQIIG